MGKKKTGELHCDLEALRGPYKLNTKSYFAKRTELQQYYYSQI